MKATASTAGPIVVLFSLLILAGCSSGTNDLPPFPAPGLTFHFDSTLGGAGSGPGQFDRPTGVAAAANNTLFIVDSGNNRIQAFSSKGVFLYAFGSAGKQPLQFRKPFGIAATASALYVTDSGNARVQQLTLKGGFVRQIGSAWRDGGDLREPTYIAANDTLIAVADAQRQCVVLFDTAGAVKQTIGRLGLEDGEFLDVAGLAVVGTTLYVADRDRNDVQAFSLPNGTFAGKLSRRGSALGLLLGPTGLAATADGLLVAEAGNARLQILSVTGEPQALVKPDKTSGGPLREPLGVAPWRGGFVVCDAPANRLVSFLPNP